MKKVLKFVLIVFVYSVLWTISQLVMPHSQAYKDMLSADANHLSAVFLFLCSAFICFVICFIAANSNWRGKKRVAGITFVSMTEDAGFIAQLMSNDPIIYLFQFVRGVMFSSFVLPLFYMLQEKGRKKFIISVCFTFLTPTALLIIPGPLFPDIVRWAHFTEMFSSMLLFGIITGLILYIPGKHSIVG